MSKEEYARRKRKHDRSVREHIANLWAQGPSESDIAFLEAMLLLDEVCPYARDGDAGDICEIDGIQCLNPVLKFVVWGHWCDTRQMPDFSVARLAEESHYTVNITNG